MPPQNVTPPPASPRKLMWIGIGLLAISAFMFISIIVKTALRGP